ncbi:hypothetical protein [Peribacillus sp. Bi96]|uniref:hypothetical protein n=1 Tax=Peribacillus sp. Bi96 TaxID=2884273 RepID=UPI001E413C9E|nr:hypothetical protein [Peribacillus sp. Bi96]
MKNSGEVVVGAIDGDMEMVKKGASGLITTVAVVGVVDIMDHEVSPGYVDDYSRSDGTAVSGY